VTAQLDIHYLSIIYGYSQSLTQQTLHKNFVSAQSISRHIVILRA